MATRPPEKVNNFKTCKPVVCKSLNIYPTKEKPRDVEEIKPVVNGKVADNNKIHKPKKNTGQKNFPVISNRNTTNRSRKGKK